MSQPAGHQVFETAETIDAWDRDYYHPIAERYYDRMIPRMLRLMGAKPGEPVLDAGCGPGVHSIRVAREGHPVRAIDLSEAMLAEAARRVDRAGLAGRVEFAREDLTKLSLPDASCRLVFSWGVVIHIPDLEKALDELARVVAPGGSLALYVTNRTGLDYRLEDLARAVTRKPLRRSDRPLGVGIEYDYHDEKLWLWRVDARAITEHLRARGLSRTHRLSGQFSEIQRRLPGAARRGLLHFNNLYDRAGLPATMAVTNLLVFRKDG